METVGILGVGHFIKHLMPAFARTEFRFILSRRSQSVSETLREQFAVDVRDDAQSIVDDADIVVLAVRPFQVADLCEDLSFRGGQIVLSLCAGVNSSDIADLVYPANVIRAMPVIAAEFGESPTLLFPENDACRRLLSPCGPVLALRDEAEFDPANVAACYFGWVQNLIGVMADWTAEQGVSDQVSRALVAQMTRAAGTLVCERPETNVDDLVTEITPPRSMTGLGLDHLRDRRAFEPWREAADLLLAEMRGKEK